MIEDLIVPLGDSLDPHECVARGDDYPSSRPGRKTLIGLAVVFFIGAGIVFWPAISPLIGF
jgi:hypothetical protein